MTVVFPCSLPPSATHTQTSATDTSSCVGRNVIVDLKTLHDYVMCLEHPNGSTAREMHKYSLYQSDLLHRGLWDHANATFHVLAPHFFSRIPHWGFLRGDAAASRYHRKTLLEKLPGRFIGEYEGDWDALSPRVDVEGYVPLAHLMTKEEQYADFASILLNQGVTLSKLAR